jgi:signal transduction histidine kinase
MGVAGSSRRLGTGFSLRGLATAGAVVLTVLALSACIALAVIATLSRHSFQRVDLATASIRSVDALRLTLLSYARESDLAYLTHDAADETARERTIRQLYDQIDTARTRVRDDEQRRLVEQAARQIGDYLDARQRAERNGKLLQDVLATATKPLQGALATLAQLATIDYRSVEDAQRLARRRDKLGSFAGIVIALMLLAAFTAVLANLRRLVFAPLISLSDGINRVAAGDPRSRVPIAGPTEFQRTAQAFNEMAERLAKQEEDQRTFLAGIAHDLRNPLAALRLRIQSIDRAEQLPPPEKIREVFSVVGKQLTRLDRMVADFLDANQIAAGQLDLQLQSIDVRQTAQDVVELYRLPPGRHTFTLSLSTAPVTTSCDPARIEQVLNNLISNAIKYSPNGGEITISVREEGGQAVVAVADQGIGIPANEIARIFDPFRRGSGAREASPGVGLGLWVSRRVAEAHGGRLDAASTVGQGTTFKLQLPLSGRDSRCPAEPPQPSV